jgi:cobyrinic acid a,c-diamide synthase
MKLSAALILGAALAASTAHADTWIPIEQVSVDEMTGRCRGLVDGPEAEADADKINEAWIGLAFHLFDLDQKKVITHAYEATGKYVAERQANPNAHYSQLNQSKDRAFCFTLLEKITGIKLLGD